MALTPTRRDGRKANQIRPLAAEQGILNRADGSARFVQGNTSVLAAVYGPAPAKSARMERADGATVDVNFKPESGMTTFADAEREALLRRSLEEVVLRSRYPRAVVSVVIQVYERVCLATPACVGGTVDAVLPGETPQWQRTPSGSVQQYMLCCRTFMGSARKKHRFEAAQKLVLDADAGV